MTVWIWLIYASFNKVIPSKNLFAPQLECVQQRKIGPISKSQFRFAIGDPSFNRLVVIVNTGIGNKVVNAIHLHGDFFVYRDFPSKNGITKHTVIFGDGSV